MRILVLNPNTTVQITERVTEALRRELPTSALFLPMTSATGEAVIATEEAFADAAHNATSMLRAASSAVGFEFDRVILACFGDPGLEAISQVTSRPVIGLAHASMLAAERTMEPYAILTAGQPWQGILEHRLRGWGAGHRFLAVHVLRSPGLYVLNHPEQALPDVMRTAEEALSAGARKVILGGAILAGYGSLMVKHGFEGRHLIDCADAAAIALERGW